VADSDGTDSDLVSDDSDSDIPGHFHSVLEDMEHPTADPVGASGDRDGALDGATATVAGIRITRGDGSE
jgi:hypothetical protein